MYVIFWMIAMSFFLLLKMLRNHGWMKAKSVLRYRYVYADWYSTLWLLVVLCLFVIVFMCLLCVRQHCIFFLMGWIKYSVLTICVIQRAFHLKSQINMHFQYFVTVLLLRSLCHEHSMWAHWCCDVTEITSWRGVTRRSWRPVNMRWGRCATRPRPVWNFSNRNTTLQLPRWGESVCPFLSISAFLSACVYLSASVWIHGKRVHHNSCLGKSPWVCICVCVCVCGGGDVWSYILCLIILCVLMSLKKILFLTWVWNVHA